MSPNPFHDPRHIRELRQQCSDKFPDICVDRVVIEGLPARRLLEASGTRSWSCSVVVDVAESRAPRSVRSVKRCCEPAASRSSSLHAGNDRLACTKVRPAVGTISGVLLAGGGVGLVMLAAQRTGGTAAATVWVGARSNE
ncbi:hypothetical protein [Nocardia abscessus]|uniref:hypothetical protein n=1 Tax=Nocardia abscessus TaxID=120957 RepID=UPI0024550648|nr:hypothetical protein [Nocardia abscessus]